MADETKPPKKGGRKKREFVEADIPLEEPPVTMLMVPDSQHVGPGRPAFQATDEQRSKVKNWARTGVPQENMALLLDIAVETLVKHFEPELKYGAAEANAAVGGMLFQKCLKGDTAAIIFWCKTKMGMKEKGEENTIFTPPDWWLKGEAIRTVLVRPGDIMPAVDAEFTEVEGDAATDSNS